jgi:cell division protein FtsI (penicillin-binding protein 3)
MSRNIRQEILWRVYGVSVLFVLFGLTIIAKIVRIQAYEGAFWRSMADSMTTRYQDIEPVRGNIYADDGSLLVTSLPIYEARMDFRADGLPKEVFAEKVDSLAWHLAHYFGDRSAQAWLDALLHGWNEGKRYFLIKSNISHNQIKTIRKFPIFRRGQFGGGFIVEQKSRRIKPFKELASRTLGYKRPSVMPVGLEGAFDPYLAGDTGKRLMKKVADGGWIPVNPDIELEPTHGKDVVSTIDVDIQDMVHEALLKGLRRHKADHGCAMVMEVESGAIKAIANLGRNGQGQYSERYNYAIGESTEPGSTFKLATVIALLESGGFSPNDSIDTEGGSVWYYDRRMQDDKHGLGYISLHEAFTLSSNVAISKAVTQAFGKRPQDFTRVLKSLRLHQPIGLPINGEGMPLIKEPALEDWSGTTLPWMSIGYEVRLTPIQILSLYNAVANDGEMVKPRFVREIREVGETVKRFEPEILNPKICDRDNLQAVREMLVSVVEEGTARGLDADNYQIAGKTGTALVATEEGYNDSEDKVYQATFVGYLPADKPQYCCMVLVNHPREGGFYGSQVAGPIFRDIADQLYATTPAMYAHQSFQAQPKDQPAPSEIGPVHRADLATMFEAWEWPGRDSLEEAQETKEQHAWWKGRWDSTAFQARPVRLDSQGVPDVRGMGLADAYYLLENAGLNVIYYGSGAVVAQSIAPGKPIGDRSIIQLQLR